MSNQEKIAGIFSGVFLLMLGIILGSLGKYQILGNAPQNSCVLSSIRDTSTRDEGYKLINPLLICEVAGNQEFSEFEGLKDELNTYIKDQINAHHVQKASVYFRGHGKWISLNGEEKYTPASLLKVPTMIAYYKFAELHPEILMQKIKFDMKNDLNDGEYFKPSQSIERGKSYTVEELIRRMIVYSDNNAAYLLLHNNEMDKNVLIEVYSDLGLSFEELPTEEKIDYLSVQHYSYFLRILVNATYLNRDMSEKALQLLTQTDFEQGIKLGLPKDIKMAHKFGERTLPDNFEANKELHDCGFVYYASDHSYLLCIMTKGYDYGDLSKVIQNISRIVYADIIIKK